MGREFVVNFVLLTTSLEEKEEGEEEEEEEDYIYQLHNFALDKTNGWEKKPDKVLIRRRIKWVQSNI